MQEVKQDVTTPAFDLRTHIKDPKTGAIVKIQHYRMDIDKTKGIRFERPIGSGNWFDGAGTQIAKGKEIVEMPLEKELEETKLKLAELQKKYALDANKILENSDKNAAGIEVKTPTGKGDTK